MKKFVMSRRFFAETCIAAATTGFAVIKSAQALDIEGTRTASDLNAEVEASVRRYYKLWETPDWHPFDLLLAKNFTFSSPAGDDHISKSEFKTRCWDTQKDHIERFDLLELYGSGEAAFVMYDGFTKNKRKFRNVEFVRVEHGMISSIECYFGGKNSFASAVSTGNS